MKLSDDKKHKNNCDNNFFKNMKELCEIYDYNNDYFGRKKNLCKPAAFIFYNQVKEKRSPFEPLKALLFSKYFLVYLS